MPDKLCHLKTQLFSNKKRKAPHGPHEEHWLVNNWPAYAAQTFEKNPFRLLEELRKMVDEKQTPKVEATKVRGQQVKAIDSRDVGGLELKKLQELLEMYEGKWAEMNPGELSKVITAQTQEIIENDNANTQTISARVDSLRPRPIAQQIIKRHAFVYDQHGDHFEDDGGEVLQCDVGEARVEGRKYCRLLYVVQPKLDEPHLYYCQNEDGTHCTETKADLHHYSTKVAVKCAEDCFKPVLPKALRDLQGQKAHVVQEDGDTLHIQLVKGQGRTYRISRFCVDFLLPYAEMPEATLQPEKPPLSDDPRPSAIRAALLAGGALQREILAGERADFFSADLESEVIAWTRQRLKANDPYEVSMASGGRPIKLNHLKLQFGIPDSDGLLPIFNFGLLVEDQKRTEAMPPLLQQLADEIHKVFGDPRPNHALVNLYTEAQHDTSKHQDQSFSEQSGAVESSATVYIARFGIDTSNGDNKVTNPLGFYTLEGQEEIAILRPTSRTLYALTGQVNMSSFHAVLPQEHPGWTISLTFRHVRNRIHPGGKFRVVNGKRDETIAPPRGIMRMSKLEMAKLIHEAGLSNDAAPEHRPNKRAQEEQDGPAKKQRVDKHQASPPPPPEDVRLVRVVSVKCPKLGLAMLDGTKIVENRAYRLPLGWNWLYISKAKDLKGLEDFKSLIDGLHYPAEVQEKCYGKAIGGIYISEIRAPADCNAYPWAKGPHCHIISHTLTLTEPVPIQKPGAISTRWSITSELERQLVEAQLPEGAPTAMDLTPLQQRLPAPGPHNPPGATPTATASLSAPAVRQVPPESPGALRQGATVKVLVGERCAEEVVVTDVRLPDDAGEGRMYEVACDDGRLYTRSELDFLW